MRLLTVLFYLLLSFFSNAQKFYLFVGTYTGTGSKGIYVYSFDATTGKVKWLTNTDTVANPSYLAISKKGKFIYAVNEIKGANMGRVNAYNFNGKTNKLKFINSQITEGENPCYVSINDSNNWIAVTNYSSGSVAMLPINKDGSLKPLSQFIQDTGHGQNAQRQEAAHLHSAVFSPDQHYLFTPDLGIDKMMIYHFNALAKKPLSVADPAFAQTDAGSGPRHFTFHPNNKFAYLIEELAGAVDAYKYHDGKLQFVQKVLTHPANYKGAIGSADIHVSPDGKFLYASNRGDENTITIFSVDRISGKLKLKGYQPTKGIMPRNFSIDPTGNFLLVAHQMTDNIVIFKRNKQTGMLTQTGKQIKVPKPVCLKFVK